MDLEEIKNIIALMKEHELSYFNLETEDTKIKLKRGADFDALEQALASAKPAAAPAPPAAASATAPSDPSPSSGSVAPDALPEGVVDITSPMVGTFYRAASPEDDSFVDIGTRVTEETVVCIIEAMKVMNEIQAEISGTVVEVLANNTDAVQYGEPLFRIKKD